LKFFVLAVDLVVMDTTTNPIDNATSEQLLSSWTMFFEALRLKSRRLRHAPCPGLEVLDIFDNGNLIWLPVPAFPKHDLLQHAGHYADSLDENVQLVVGPPELPQVKRWPDGFVSVEGAVAVTFAPTSSWLGESPFRFDLRWHALQEDFWGSLSIWPFYADDLPLRKEYYTKTSECPGVMSGPVFAVYCGCGRTPTGPRLRKAYEAVQAAK
jgi:hypothetical protein